MVGMRLRTAGFWMGFGACALFNWGIGMFGAIKERINKRSYAQMARKIFSFIRVATAVNLGFEPKQAQEAPRPEVN